MARTLRAPRARAAASRGRGALVVVLRSRAEALRPLQTLRAGLAAAVAAVVLASLLSYAVARTVTRPLAAITAAMREMAATGDLARRIGPGRAVGRRGRAACWRGPSTP